MDRGSARLGAAALALVGLWIVVYWWSPAGPASPSIAFDSRPGESPAQRPSAAATLPDRKPADPPPLSLSSPPSSTGASGQPQHPVGEPAPTELKQPAPAPKQAPASLPAQPTPRQPVVRKPGETIPPTFYLYAVEPGDTAEKISKRFYGSPDQWAAVLKANPQTDFTRLKAGQSIRVPKDPVNIQGVPGAPDEPAPEPKPAKGQSPTRYTVKEGDTLSDIAKAFYGKTALWTAIRDANRDLVGDDGRAMRPGQKLTIPPLPAQTPR